MGRVKARRAAARAPRFEIISSINGCFFGMEFFDSERDFMRQWWDDEAIRCGAGDSVELLDNGKVVRRFDGNCFLATSPGADVPA